MKKPQTPPCAFARCKKPRREAAQLCEEHYKQYHEAFTIVKPRVDAKLMELLDALVKDGRDPRVVCEFDSWPSIHKLQWTPGRMVVALRFEYADKKPIHLL